MELFDIKDEIKDMDKPIDWIYKEVKEYLLLKGKESTSKQMLYNRYFYILGIVDSFRFSKHLSRQTYTEVYNMLNRK